MSIHGKVRYVTTDPSSLPDGWSQIAPAPSGAERLRYTYVLDREDTIEVWLEEHISATGSATYFLRANTVEFLGARHENDFEIDSYEELLEAERATVEFLTLLTGRLDPDSPDDRRLYLTVQAVVDEFSGDDRGFWRRLSERLHRGF